MSLAEKTTSAILFFNEPVQTDIFRQLERNHKMFNFRFPKQNKTGEEQKKLFLDYITKNFYPATEYKLEALYLGYSGFHPLPEGLTEKMIEDHEQLQHLKVVALCSRGINKVPAEYLKEKFGCVVQNYDDSELYVANDVADCGMFHVLESFRKFSYQQNKLREVLHSDDTRGHLRGDAANELRFCFGHELKIVDDDGVVVSAEENKEKEKEDEKENEKKENEKEKKEDQKEKKENEKGLTEKDKPKTEVLEYMYTTSPMHKKVLILGFGKIGQTLAKKLKYGLSMDVYYSTRSGENTTDKSFAEFKYYQWGKWTDELSQFDCIVLCLPLSPQTKHLVDEEFLLNCSRFEKGNLNHLSLVNLGRGLLIDWAKIPKNFIKSRIRHIGLDVFYAEPVLTRECDDLTSANSSVTPHIGSSTFEVFNRSSEFCLNLILKTLKN